jgi:hypothetical protein
LARLESEAPFNHHWRGQIGTVEGTYQCSQRNVVSGYIGLRVSHAHHEANFSDPNNSLGGNDDGFVSQNDQTKQPDQGETPTDDDTMGF